MISVAAAAEMRHSAIIARPTFCTFAGPTIICGFPPSLHFHSAFRRFLCDLLRFSRDAEKLSTCKEGEVRMAARERCKNRRRKSVCPSVRLPSRLSVRRPPVCLSVCRLRDLKSPKAEQCHEQSRLRLRRRRSIIRETFSFFSLEKGKMVRRVTTTRKATLTRSLFHLVTRSLRETESASLASGTFAPPSHLPRHKAKS